MTLARRVLVLVVIAVGLEVACGLRSRTQQPQQPPKGETTVVLLAEPDGTVGRATVSNPSGSVELDTSRGMTRVTTGGAPAPVTQMSEADVQRIFGAALMAQPPAPAHFTLYFQFNSDELTDDSRKLVIAVQQAVKIYPAPQIAVTGHTDTVGSATANIGLGLRRANVARTRLVEAGLDGSSIAVTSHGEATLLVPTTDEVSEPRNRRVEITVR